MDEPRTIEDALALIAEHPEDAELFQVLGQRYLEAGRRKEAREALERSLALDPNDAWAHMFLGHSWYGHAGNPRKALDHFRRAAELMPDEPIVHTCQGDVYNRLGQNDQAEAAYRTAVEVAPDDPFARRKLAEWYEYLHGEPRR